MAGLGNSHFHHRGPQRGTERTAGLTTNEHEWTRMGEGAGEMGGCTVAQGSVLREKVHTTGAVCHGGTLHRIADAA